MAASLAVTRMLDVPDEVALQGMYTAIPDVGACTRWHLQHNGRPIEFLNVFAANDLLAIGALQAARQAGLQVPRDLSIVGLDDIFAASTTTPPLTTIAKPKDRNGHQAACFLVERICNEAPAEPRRHISPCALKLRGSTAPPRH